MRTKLIAFLLPLLLSACTGQYSALQNKMGGCGYPTAPYTKFHECMKGAVTVSDKASQNDAYNKARKEFLTALNELQVMINKKKITNKRAYAILQEYMNIKIRVEQQQAQQAVVALAVLAGAAVVVSCAKHGCGGGGSYSGSNYRPYPGNCQYSWQIAADGKRCGNRAASVRPGGY